MVYENVIAPYAEPSRDKLLPDIPAQLKGREKPTLVISLDGTLIESTWTRHYGWRYVKRPGVDQFLASLAPHFELVMWTESMNTADPVVVAKELLQHSVLRGGCLECVVLNSCNTSGNKQQGSCKLHL